MQSTPCNTKGAKAKEKIEDSNSESLHHAVLVLGEGCNNSLMSTNSSKAYFDTLVHVLILSH